MVKELSDEADYAQLVDTYDNWLFDLDGVVWHSEIVIPGVLSVLKYLRSKNKKLIFVTNNATKSRQDLLAKFQRLGIEAYLEEIFGSAFAAAAYLKYKLHFAEDKHVYVIGEQGLETELEAVGIKHKGGTDPEDNVFLPSMDFGTIQSDPTIGAVLCGFDMHINYKKLAKAHRYLIDDPNCLFMLTNDDSSFPDNGTVYPGSGAISAPLRYALPDRKPIITGKPNSAMLDSIIETHKLDKSKTLMVGDRLDTDIAFGVNGGISTLMVLTGVNKKADYEKEGAPTVPEYLMTSLGDLSALAAPEHLEP